MVSAGDSRRLFLQSILSRGMISGKLATTLWTRCAKVVKDVDGQVGVEIPDPTDKAAWDQFVTDLNESINKMDLEFRRMVDETNGKEMYALVNRNGNDIAQMSTDYTPAEIMYFKAVVEQIMLAPNEIFSISSMAALREVTYLKTNMTKTQAEVVLGSFVANGWLIKSQRGRYSLSTRTLLELVPYLKSTYPEEFVECTICMEMITRGVGCATANCKGRMHFHCFSAYRRRHTKCPTCNTQAWPQEPGGAGLIAVGEDAVKKGQEERRQVRMNSVGDSDEDGEGEPDEDEDEEASQQATQKKKAPAKKGKAKKVKKEVSEDEDDEMEQDDNEEDSDAAPKKRGARRSTRRSS